MKPGSERRPRGGRAPRRADPRSGNAKAHGPASTPGWIALALVIALALAGIAWWRSRPHSARPAADSAAALDPLDAYRRAVALVGTGRLRESLPMFRRALGGLSTDFCEIHYNYGVTLGALSMQYRPRAGLSVPATHSSVERVALVREALSQLDRAMELARDRNARVGVSRSRTVVWTSWGFPWEALGGFDEVRRADSTDAWGARESARYLRAMQDPSGARFVPDSLARAVSPDPARP